MFTIIGVLVALLLPAISAAREAVRRINCANNLANVATALIQYEIQNKRFPYGMQIKNQETLEIGEEPFKGTSGLVGILPFLESKNIYDDYRFDLPVTDPENTEAVESAIAIYRCPSDDAAREVTVDQSTFARSNYVLCFGSAFLVRAQATEQTTTEGERAPLLTPDLESKNRWDTNGPFRADGARNAAALLEDGFSKTVLVSEVIASTEDFEPGDPRGIWAMYLAGSSFYTHQFPPNDTQGDAIFATLGFECIEEDRMPCSETPPESIGGQFASARSGHSGGVMVSYADKHTTFVNDRVDLVVWRAIATIDGGENVEIPE